MVFQNYALYPHQDRQGNMSFGLKMTTDLSKAEINERVEDVAAMMGIEDLLEKKPVPSPAGSNSASRSGGPSSANQKCS